MTNLQQFTQREIPYDILEKFGLTSKMIEDLPQNVTERFLSGKATPVLPVTMEKMTAGDDKFISYARISLIRLPDGTVDLCFAPKWDDVNLKEFTQEVQEKLLLGEVAAIIMPDKGLCFVQLDEAINQVMTVPAEIINQNISILARSYAIPYDKISKLKDGGVTEIEINEQILSTGVDLNEPTGIRIVNGDTQTWREDAKADRLPKYNFGLWGCWVADEENSLTYIPEEDYTEEMYRELERAGNQNATREKLNQFKKY